MIRVGLSTGIAIFSMFFGSGNVVFPLLLGATSGDRVSWALVGLMLTAVGAPLLGLFASVLFQGDCKRFFYRIGVIPGYLFVLLILALVGPLGVMPRCFVVAFGAIQRYFPSLSLFAFSVIMGLATFVSVIKRSYILPVLGYVLSPMLVLSLLVIIGVSLYEGGPLQSTTLTPLSAILSGFTAGYQTMDLLGAIFFSVSIWMLLQEKLQLSSKKEIQRQLIPTYLLASLVGGGLLACIYTGLGYASAFHAKAVQQIASEQALSFLAVQLLGPKLAIIANVAIVLACFTTVISLTVAVVDVIHVEIAGTWVGKRVLNSYSGMIGIVLFMTVMMSHLGFIGIMRFLHPIVVVCYPAVLMLTVCNVLYKLYHFPYVKGPVWSVFGLSVLWQGIEWLT